MGFFERLFEKKICDVCGRAMKSEGSCQLQDGVCCKDCADRLSPWFRGRRSCTVEEIRGQLAYRETNKADVAVFHPTRVLGGETRVMLDEKAGRFLVTSAADWREGNPDVLRLDQVWGCDLEVEEVETEVRRKVRDKDGHRTYVSYTPRRYQYTYDFYLTIHMHMPYFDKIRFRINDAGVEVVPIASRTIMESTQLEGSLMPPTRQDCREDPEYSRCETLGREMREALMRVQLHVRGEGDAAKPGEEDR